MEKSRQLVALFHLYDISKQSDHRDRLYESHLEEIGFSKGEIAYVLEIFQEKGWLSEGRVFSTCYYFNSREKRLVESLLSEV